MKSTYPSHYTSMMKTINSMGIVGTSPSDYTSMITDISNIKTDDLSPSFDLYNNNNSDTISVISVVSDNSPILQDYDLEINSIFENKLQQMGMDELKEKCKQNGMNGLSKLKKQDLIQLLLTEFNIIWVMLKNTCLQDLIEAYFNQIKNTLKKDRNVENYQQLEKNVDGAIEKVKPENYKNYFEYAYNLKDGMEIKRIPSTRRRKLKIYK